MKRTVMTVLLSVILVIGVVCGVYFLKQAVALRADGESAVASAVEMAGAMGALLAVLPLMQAAWEVLRSLL